MPGEIQVFYSESYEEANLKEHFHNYYEIVLIKEGCADFKIGTKTYSLSKNMLIFISNLESHEVTVKTFPYKRFFILILSCQIFCLRRARYMNFLFLLGLSATVANYGIEQVFDLELLHFFLTTWHKILISSSKTALMLTIGLF